MKNYINHSDSGNYKIDTFISNLKALEIEMKESVTAMSNLKSISDNEKSELKNVFDQAYEKSTNLLKCSELLITVLDKIEKTVKKVNRFNFIRAFTTFFVFGPIPAKLSPGAKSKYCFEF